MLSNISSLDQKQGLLHSLIRVLCCELTDSSWFSYQIIRTRSTNIPLGIMLYIKRSIPHGETFNYNLFIIPLSPQETTCFLKHTGKLSYTKSSLPISFFKKNSYKVAQEIMLGQNGSAKPAWIPHCTTRWLMKACYPTWRHATQHKFLPYPGHLTTPIQRFKATVTKSE